METIDDTGIDPAHKKSTLILCRDDTLYYYRWVIRTLTNAPIMAKEYLELDRDEELEAVHHLELDKSLQVMFELALWHSMMGN
jgi:hypothetical protein